MKNKVILILGATSMIGRACAQLFAEQGVKLMLVGRNQLQLDELANALTAEIEVCVADISTQEDVEFVINKTMQSFSQLDGVIYNVAIYPWKSLEELSLAQWQQTMNTNLTGAFLTAQACFAVMKRQGAGNIIFISSIAGEVIGLPYMSAYATTKAGMNGLMRTAAIEFAPYNIKVNSISPGKVYSADTMSASEYTAKIAPIPLQRFIEPLDIANMAMFLLSDKAKNITGQNIIVDGGQSIA